MNTILVIALILAMAATLYALIRGIVAFLQTTKEELNLPEGVVRPSSLKQNKMMMNRILFQAAAIIIVAILLMAKGHG
ncbi:twin transmembrane helix small protein [Sphingobium sp. AR-3-1]|uniref:Twin transmembrane helix small protein n=1 Tax=Sphingobium psychrophilum TaxID=2728834 RepID=A0A7X9WTR1_9SPHN|nr:twin transmembrane helix small protein [Sphingobium psychrophilum]NML09767.1 twin transmembrane helix small protein [Sphingobium psychrophilum]